MKTKAEKLLKAYYAERFGTPESSDTGNRVRSFLSVAALTFSLVLATVVLWNGRTEPSFPAVSIAENLRHGNFIDFCKEPLTAVRDNGFGGER